MLTYRLPVYYKILHGAYSSAQQRLQWTMKMYRCLAYRLGMVVILPVSLYTNKDKTSYFDNVPNLDHLMRPKILFMGNELICGLLQLISTLFLPYLLYCVDIWSNTYSTNLRCAVMLQKW